MIAVNSCEKRQTNERIRSGTVKPETEPVIDLNLNFLFRIRSEPDLIRKKVLPEFPISGLT